MTVGGKISAKNAVITITDSGNSARNVSADCKSFAIEQNAGPIEVTGFTDAAKNYIPGLPVQGITLDFYWNTLASTGIVTVLRSILGLNPAKTVSITPEVGGTSFSGLFMLDSLPSAGTPAGELTIGSVHFSVFGSTGAAWA
jgi:hypothetical protein